MEVSVSLRQWRLVPHRIAEASMLILPPPLFYMHVQILENTHKNNTEMKDCKNCRHKSSTATDQVDHTLTSLIFKKEKPILWNPGFVPNKNKYNFLTLIKEGSRRVNTDQPVLKRGGYQIIYNLCPTSEGHL